MKKSIFIILCLLFSNALIMATMNDWVKFTEQKTGIHGVFPSQPQELNFDLPFENTSEKGNLHFLYSANVGELFGVANYSPLEMKEINQQELFNFFQNILFPHCFCGPTQLEKKGFQFIKTKWLAQDAWAFQLSARDGEEIKLLEGQVILKDKNWFIAFYLANKDQFDESKLDRFLSEMSF